MNDDEKTKLIVNFIKRTDHMFGVISQAIAHHAIAFLDTLQKCDVENCNQPATVVHISGDRSFCDRCCAETIYEARMHDLYIDNASQSKDSQESSWRDLSNAYEVRAIAHHKDLCTELDVKVVH